MLRNYLITALRTIEHNKLHAAINMIGLAVGFAAALFAALFVRYELTYNHWIPGYARVYTVLTSIHHPRGAPPEEWTYAHRDTAQWLQLDFPEVEAAARMRSQGSDTVVRRGQVFEVEDYGAVAAADPNIFSVLPFTAIVGNLQTALKVPDGLVITRTFAHKYFGTDAPLGEMIELDQHLLRVTAVIDDLPTNTAFPASGRLGAIISGLAPFSILKRWDDQQFDASTDPWVMVYGGTFVRLKPGASIESLQSRMAEFTSRHIRPDILEDVKMSLLPITALHPLAVNRPEFNIARARFYALIIGVAGIGALIVLAACINYINGVTARAVRRAVEVGVRKVSGAARLQLVVQFIGESLVYAALAAGIAVVLVKLVLPGSAAYLDREIVFSVWRDPSLGAALCGSILVVGTLAGLYPAFMLSSLRPAAVLKSGAVVGHGSSVLRELLVGLQFAILIAVVAATAVVYRQTQYAMKENARFDTDQVVVIDGGCTSAAKAEIIKVPGVQTASCGTLQSPAYRSFVRTPAGTDFDDVQLHPIDDNFFTVLPLVFLAGEPPPRQQPNDIVINDMARRRFGFASPAAAIGQVIQWRRVGPERQSVDAMPYVASRIAGVLDDYATSVTEAISAELYYADPAMIVPAGSEPKNRLSVRLTGRAVPETLHAIDQLWPKLVSDRPIKRRFLDQFLQENYRDLDQLAMLVAAFAIVALFVATIGIFSLASFAAESRTKEIGIRKAMGASSREILGLMLWQFAKPVLWANVIAWPVAAFLMQRWLEGFASHIDLQLWMFAGAGVIAIVVAIATVFGQAMLVARSKPVTALRYE